MATRKRKATPASMLLGNRIRALRLDVGLEVTQVASSLGIARSSIYDIECGYTVPDVITAGAICAFYDAPLDFLVTGTGMNRELRITMDDFDTKVIAAMMTPIDMSIPNTIQEQPASGGLLHLPQLPVAVFDLRRQAIRGSIVPQPKVHLTQAKRVKPPITAADLVGAGLIKLPVTPKTKRKQRKAFDVSALAM